MTFGEAVTLAGEGVEAVGVAIIVVGTAGALLRFAVSTAVREDHQAVYARSRRGIGRALLLGLEVLVAGDIIRTVAVEPTLTAAATLAIIVLIRTFLSWSIELETEGRWPWQQSGASGRP